MRKSRFTDEQIVAMLQETDRDGVAAVAKRHGVSEQANYGWQKKFGAFQANDVRSTGNSRARMPGRRGSSLSATSRSR